MKLTIHTDGGARGNPGPAAIGVVIDGVASFGKKIGETTNNVAEYTAIIEAFRYLRDEQQTMLGDKDKYIQFYLDSLLVVNQLKGIYKVKDMRLRELLMAIRMLEQEIGGIIVYTHVPREENREADKMVNEALDSQ